MSLYQRYMYLCFDNVGGFGLQFTEPLQQRSLQVRHCMKQQSPRVRLFFPRTRTSKLKPDVEIVWSTNV